ncbi:amino acid permease [Sphingopyxis alaskensis]|uniref:Arginine/agmatine antiporter n=1 Tax=Sphingopyxis alaskensis (strain DSM 13593 / LMG 18877 / RB2256) TaxID=317655 RepID=Q1GNA2_SPHAL|nr:amino acid permease [Sphingopyxis alaskensis]ABF54870.1 amino acid permease-associated region [Sphingopyxis alaskensis RB2256]
MSDPANRHERPRRKLGLSMAIALVMGNMIGSGVFLLPASLAPFGWNGVAGWAITIGGALALAFVLARLTALHPDAGGPTGFVERAFGRIPSFMIGWAYWVSVWTANVTLAVAAVSFLSLFVPALGQHTALSTIALIWIVTAINWRGARAAGQFQVVTLLIKLIPLVTVIILIPIAFGRSEPVALTPFPADGLSLAAVSGSAILTLWALLGFESASVAADKVANPAVTIPRATIVGTLATGILYLIVCSAIALMLPAAEVAKSEAPFSLFVETWWGREPALFIGAFAAVSALGTLNGWTLIQAELPATLARQGLLPSWFGRENRHGTPTAALLLSSAIATACVLLNSSKSTSEMFTFMAVLSTSVTLWLYLACAAAALRMRVAIPVALIGLVYAVWTLWGAGIGVSAMSLILMAAGLPLYAWTMLSAPAGREEPPVA